MTFRISAFPTQTHSIRWRQHNAMGQFIDFWITPDHRDYLNGVTPCSTDRDEIINLFEEMFGR